MLFRGSRDTNKVFREGFFPSFGSVKRKPSRAIQSTLRSLEMHSKERYEVCVYLFGHPRKA